MLSFQVDALPRNQAHLITAGDRILRLSCSRGSRYRNQRINNEGLSKRGRAPLYQSNRLDLQRRFNKYWAIIRLLAWHHSNLSALRPEISPITIITTTTICGLAILRRADLASRIPLKHFETHRVSITDEGIGEF